MRKLMMIAVVVAAAAFVVRRVILGGSVDWEGALAKMPDDAPPKWMFSNIEAIRRNTDRILQRMDALTPEPTGSVSVP